MGGAAVLAPPHFQNQPVPFRPSSFPFLLPFSVKSSVILLFLCITSARHVETSSVLASSKPQFPVRPVPGLQPPPHLWRCWEGPCFSEGTGESGRAPPSSQTARSPVWDSPLRPPPPSKPQSLPETPPSFTPTSPSSRLPSSSAACGGTVWAARLLCSRAVCYGAFTLHGLQPLF